MYWADDSGKDSFVMVVDDGDGMDEQTLLEKALTLPKEDHIDQGDHDLSMFGLGLKTGSFQHCTSITAITKKNDNLIKASISLYSRLSPNLTALETIQYHPPCAFC